MGSYFASFETYLLPWTESAYGWSTWQVSLLLIGALVLVAPVLIAYDRVLRVAGGPPRLLLLAFSTVLTGMLVAYQYGGTPSDVPAPRFVVGAGLVYIGTPSSAGASVLLLRAYFPPALLDTYFTEYFGLALGIGYLGKALTPLWVAHGCAGFAHHAVGAPAGVPPGVPPGASQSCPYGDVALALPLALIVSALLWLATLLLLEGSRTCSAHRADPTATPAGGMPAGGTPAVGTPAVGTPVGGVSAGGTPARHVELVDVSVVTPNTRQPMITRTSSSSR